MKPKPEPTWITLFSLCAICVAALFLIVPLLRTVPVAQMAVTLIILVCLFDVIALWLQANAEVLKQPSMNAHRKAHQHLLIRRHTTKKSARKPADSDHHDAAS